jgi:dihydroorotate dehydrogenase electron transfer subunit
VSVTARTRPPQVTGELVDTRRVGAYQQLTFVAPGVAELARPGQFVALAVGGDTSANLLRRCFSIHKVNPGGTQGGTVDVVVAARGPAPGG